MDLLDEALVYSNATLLLYIIIRDLESDHGNCVASGLEQHSHIQRRPGFEND